MHLQVKDVAENPLAKQVSITRKDTSGGMETRLLENSINKICSLLAIGFGDAGGQVRGPCVIKAQRLATSAAGWTSISEVLPAVEFGDAGGQVRGP